MWCPIILIENIIKTLKHYHQKTSIIKRLPDNIEKPNRVCFQRKHEITTSTKWFWQKFFCQNGLTDMVKHDKSSTIHSFDRSIPKLFSQYILLTVKFHNSFQINSFHKNGITFTTIYILIQDIAQSWWI